MTVIHRNINKINKNNETPLINLCKYTFKEYLIPLLIENSANINVVDNEGNTSLLICYKNGKEKMILKLIKNGADVNKTDNTGSTPLVI